MLLVNIQEALGLSYEQALDSSFALIKALLMEYSYMWIERNRENAEDEHGEFEYIELPSWDDPTQMVRMKKYDDIGSFIS